LLGPIEHVGPRKCELRLARSITIMRTNGEINKERKIVKGGKKRKNWVGKTSNG